ncbi:slipin family protein [Microbulbifer hydrolyticus]|uniref:Regulator of protease activity HflC (Stomatin/prohibitin superfamily) n=1 Tax=Microbulbifer hydrolyticus TaxID=48074 RepID=A0A6P1TEL6_9GAMM|nr:slipin family protein [Microbulbifer hydrolyticus]MBB5212017.1 regulator of protease activity HflC (stomatin/prohibitin superfamily) [Microbulbifer hydrolyticus]QHQ39699.1 slipin family protein [Microbulbifer hydrolyticus]
MYLWKTIEVPENMRALVFQRGRFRCLLDPGSHRFGPHLHPLAVERYEVTDLLIPRPKVKYLLRNHPELEQHIECIETSDSEVALLYRDGRLEELMLPAREMAIWKGVDPVAVEKINLHDSLALTPELATALRFDLPASLEKKVRQLIYFVDVPDHHRGLLLVNRQLHAWLEPGYYAYWQPGRSIQVNLVDLRMQLVEVSGQEILTRDRVSLRINLSASYRVVDIEKADTITADYTSHVYRALQLALREAVGTRKLDELLENKRALNGDIEEILGEDLSEIGVKVCDIGVKDIVLPGEMKTILNRVVEAQKEAEANLIRRREETQAVRALHNTAKMMESNSTLMRLKELEALERVTGKIERISVYGGLEGLMTEFVKLRSPPCSPV